MCLIENGALLDARNKNGKTAVDVAATDIACDIIKAHMKLGLKCLTARVVSKYKVKDEDVIC